MFYIQCPIIQITSVSVSNQEKIWRHTLYNVLRRDPEETQVLMTEKPMNPQVNREKMAEIMFETFNTPSFYISLDAELTLIAAGRTTGVILDIGHEVTYSTPIYENKCFHHSIRKSQTVSSGSRPTAK